MKKRSHFHKLRIKILSKYKKYTGQRQPIFQEFYERIIRLPLPTLERNAKHSSLSNIDPFAFF